MQIRPMVFVTVSLLLVCTGFAAHAQEERLFTEPNPFAESYKQQFAAYDLVELTVVPLKHATAEKVVKTMAAFGIDKLMTADDELNAIILFGPKEITRKFKEAIELLDSAGSTEENNRNVELTVHIIRGSAFKKEDLKLNPPQDAADIPNALGKVIDELREVFSYDQYRLVDTLFLRCRDGSEASTSGILPNKPNDSLYRFRIQSVRVTEGDPHGIRLDELSFDAEISITSARRESVKQPQFHQIQRPDVGIEADIDLREGQHVVVGKASISDDNSALFVVVSAKVVGG